MTFAVDRLVLTPDDIDLARSPLAGLIDRETFVLGAFNPGLTRLANGNLLMMVRVAEALRDPVWDGRIHSIAWTPDGYALPGWPLDRVDRSDPRKFRIRDEPWRVMALTSLSWLLPVELDAQGLAVVAVHYDRAVAPHASFQSAGVEDARISRIDGRYWMTTCSVSPERHSTTLYASDDGLDWRFEAMVLDHQNKDMLLFEGQVDGRYWAQTRPLGDQYFAYPPDSEWRAGPSINLAVSPDLLHWRPWPAPGIRPHAATRSTARMGGCAPPILTDRGWLSLWHGVEPNGSAGVYRTYWSILDRDDPTRTVATEHHALLEANPRLTAPLSERMYLSDIVFTTGAVDGGDHWIVASGEADLACRITHVPKSRFA